MKNMDDSNIEIGYIEYAKDMVNMTEIDNDEDTPIEKDKKMPNYNKPPRDQKWENEGFANDTVCKTRWNVDPGTNLTEMKYKYGKNYALNVTREDNKTFTVTICERMQKLPERRYKNGTYTKIKELKEAEK